MFRSASADGKTNVAGPHVPIRERIHFLGMHSRQKMEKQNDQITHGPSWQAGEIHEMLKDLQFAMHRFPVLNS
jgi:hypothetical protein